MRFCSSVARLSSTISRTWPFASRMMRPIARSLGYSGQKGDRGLAFNMLDQHTCQHLTAEQRGIAIADQHGIRQGNERIDSIFCCQQRISGAKRLFLQGVDVAIAKAGFNLLRLVTKHDDRAKGLNSRNKGGKNRGGGNSLNGIQYMRQ